MFKTISYFFLFYTLFCQFSWGQDVKQGLYFVNGGLANKKTNTKKYAYGVGFNYRHSEKLDFTGLGIRHHFALSEEETIDMNEKEEIKLNKNEIDLSYGLENSDTQRYGIKYPIHVRGQYNVNVMDALVETHLSNRYFPDFYDGDVLHFLSFGSSLKKQILNEDFTFHAGGELSRLWNANHQIFANYFFAFQRVWEKQYFTRFEYSDNLNNTKVAHIQDWLATVTLGFIY